MPQQTYTVRDPTTGRTVKLTGDSPPTEAELEQVFSQLHPGASRTAPDAPQRVTSSPGNTNGSTVGSLVTGALKGATNTVIGLGELVHKIPGVSSAVDALYGTPGLSAASFPVAREAVKPQGAAENIGYGAEQIGEFFVPGVGTGGRIARGAKAAGLTLAQTGSPTTAGMAGTLSAALPGAGAAQRTATALEEGAERAMGRALGPTKEATKAQAAKIVPGMVERGVKGSRPQMLAQAEKKTAELGQAIKAEIDAAAARGETIAARPIRAAIEEAAATLATTDASGMPQIIPGTETVVKRLAKLDKFVESLGDNIPIDQAAKVKRVWDQIVSKAGLYGQKVGASSTDSANAWATREAAGAFRSLLNSGNATLEGLNKEFAFWKGVRDVLGQTALRTQGQSGGLTGVAMAGTGAVIGGSSGTSVSDRVQNAIIGGVAGKNLVKLLNSPQWLTRVSVPLRTMLADALASGNAARIESAAKTILTATPSLASQ